VDEKDYRSSGILIAVLADSITANNQHAMRQRDLLRFGVKLIAFRSADSSLVRAIWNNAVLWLLRRFAENLPSIVSRKQATDARSFVIRQYTDACIDSSLITRRETIDADFSLLLSASADLLVDLKRKQTRFPRNLYVCSMLSVARHYYLLDGRKSRQFVKEKLFKFHSATRELSECSLHSSH